jgi:hypothetical protein
MQLILMFRTIIARKVSYSVLHCPLGNTALHTRSVGASAAFRSLAEDGRRLIQRASNLPALAQQWRQIVQTVARLVEACSEATPSKGIFMSNQFFPASGIAPAGRAEKNQRLKIRTPGRRRPKQDSTWHPNDGVWCVGLEMRKDVCSVEIVGCSASVRRRSLHFPFQYF